MFLLFIKGFLIGLALAAPVGPVALLCINRSLQYGFGLGFISGIGAGLADGVYACIAGFGITALITLLVEYEVWIQRIGGIGLLLLGFKLLSSPLREKNTNDNDPRKLHAFVSTFFLTLSNPATLLAFIAILATLRLGTAGMGYGYGIALVLGITCGSTVWWLSLTSLVSFVLHHRISSAVLQRINQASGFLLMIVGLFVIGYSFRQWF